MPFFVSESRGGGVQGMWKRIHGLFWIVVAGFLIYMGISVYFMEHFFPGTTVNGQKAAFLTTAQVEEEVFERAGSYELVLQAQDGQEVSLTPEKLGVSFYHNDEVRKVKRKQNGFLWPRMFWQKDAYEIVPGIRLEEEQLDKILQNLDWLHQGNNPENAWVEMTKDGYQVHKEKQGTRINEAVLKVQVQGAIFHLLPKLDLRESGCYVEPSVTVESEEILKLQALLDQWLCTRVTYVFGSEKEVAGKEAVSSFVTLKGYEAAIDPERVAAWVKQLAKNRDTYRTPRKFKSTQRGTVTVPGGNMGWQIDQAAETKALLSHVEKGETLEKEPAYLRTGNPWSSNYDIGDTYIEVDLTAQHMWVYKEGELLIETDVVTGNMRRGYDTPAMVAFIQYKARNAVLRGEGYASPVKYWMPFYGNYGIHDAGWRKKFGGDIYLTNGSHGCVNTPGDAMGVISENVEKGTPVILYY